MTLFNKVTARGEHVPFFSFHIIATAALICVVTLLSGCSKPDFSDINGNTGDFSDFHGKWVVVNYWAEWCGPCREEIPEFNSLARNFADQTEVIAVSFDTLTVEELSAQAKRMGIEYRALTHDPAKILGIGKPSILPTTYIFKPDGSFDRELIGSQTEASIIKLLSLSK